MSASDFPEEEGEGYFASVSDLMVGILFVFLLMLTVFALNLRDTEDVSKKRYDEKVDEAYRAKKEADNARKNAEAEQAKNAKLQGALNKAVERMKQELGDRENARRRLLDHLEQTLKDQGVSVIVDPDHGVLRLPESLLFEKGQSALGAGEGAGPARLQSARDALAKVSDSLAKVLPCFVANAPSAPACDPRDQATLEGVLIEGHSDRQPFHDIGRTVTPQESDDRNDRLSVERALTVFNEIKQRNGLDKLANANGVPLLAVSAYGYRRPVATGSTAEDYQKNRRIDLRFLLASRTSDELRRLIDEIQPALGQAQ